MSERDVPVRLARLHSANELTCAFTDMSSVCHSSSRSQRNGWPDVPWIRCMSSSTVSLAPVLYLPKSSSRAWSRTHELKSVGRVCRNLRESSTRGKGICGRLPSHGKTENGVPNQLGSDVPRIVHGRRLLPIARWRLAVAAIAGTSEGRPLRGAPILVAPKDEE